MTRRRTSCGRTWPLWPGLECAGVVLEAPANGRFKPGDRVCALLGGGGYAERAKHVFAPYIHKALPITKATEAHAILERGENRGKVVLTV